MAPSCQVTAVRALDSDGIGTEFSVAEALFGLAEADAVHRFLGWGALPVGAVVAGFVGDWLGLQAAIGACASAAGLGGLVTLPALIRSAPATFAPEPADPVHG